MGTAQGLHDPSQAIHIPLIPKISHSIPVPVNYTDYLHLPALLSLQQPISFAQGNPAHDERLFIVIHQTYELWFGQLLFEVQSVMDTLSQPSIDDDSPELQVLVHRLQRCHVILKLLVQQIDTMETMSPMDFLDFRDMLRPASGFQSWQFKLLEAKLGLPFAGRHGQEHYLSQLKAEQVALVKAAESENTLLQGVNDWLQRMPFFKSNPGLHSFWITYRGLLMESLAPEEKGNISAFDTLFADETTGKTAGSNSLSPAARRAGLFIMLYQGQPVLQLPFQLLNALLEMDEQLSTWRFRHMHMVHRTIGTRIGTGGSSGQGYLEGTVEKHAIFKEIAQLTSFLIERKKLPDWRLG